MNFKHAIATYRGHTVPHFRIIERRRLWFALSGIVIVLSLLGIFVRHFNLSIDFKGGQEIDVHLRDAGDGRRRASDAAHRRRERRRGPDRERDQRLDPRAVPHREHDGGGHAPGRPRHTGGDRPNRHLQHRRGSHVGQGDLAQGVDRARRRAGRHHAVHHVPLRVEDGDRRHGRARARHPDHRRRVRADRPRGHARRPSSRSSRSWGSRCTTPSSSTTRSRRTPSPRPS